MGMSGVKVSIKTNMPVSNNYGYYKDVIRNYVISNINKELAELRVPLRLNEDVVYRIVLSSLKEDGYIIDKVFESSIRVHLVEVVVPVSRVVEFEHCYDVYGLVEKLFTLDLESVSRSFVYFDTSSNVHNVERFQEILKSISVKLGFYDEVVEENIYANYELMGLLASYLSLFERSLGTVTLRAIVDLLNTVCSVRLNVIFRKSGDEEVEVVFEIPGEEILECGKEF